MVTVDTVDLEKSIDTYVDLLTKALKNSVTQVMYGTASAIVENTPVGDNEKYFERYQQRQLDEGWEPTPGMLMANWYFELNATDGLFDSSARDESGDHVTNSIRDVMMQYKIGDSILVTNETPYAPNIEGGQSKEKQPQGMLRPIEAALLDIYKIQFKDFLNG